MSWGAVVSVGASLLGGIVSSNAGEDAADAQQRASDAATAEARRQYDQTRTDLQPWMQAGGWALDRQQDYLSGDMSGFINSAGYQAANRNGLAALASGHAAEGNLWGGGADADRIQFGQDNAWRFGSEYFNQLGGVSGTGQSAANQLGMYGQQFGQQYGQNAMNAADAQSSAYMNTANQWGNVANTAAGAWNWYHGNRPGGG